MLILFMIRNLQIKQKEGNMESCQQCGEDLVVNPNQITKCSNVNCETNQNQMDGFDKIQHLENQIILENNFNQ